MSGAPSSRNWRRPLGAALAGLVFVLGLAGASPELHSWLHSNGIPADDSGCVITAFHDTGTTIPVEEILLQVPERWQRTPELSAESVVIAAPRYLRQPERGPPAA